MTNPDNELPTLAPGTYQLVKRIVVNDEGKSTFIDEPGGEAISGFWHRTLTGVRRVSDDAGKSDELVAATIRTAVDEWRVHNDRADVHGVSMPEYIRRSLADAGFLASRSGIAEAEARGLSHALLLKGYRGFADQVDAMAKRIRELEAELNQHNGRSS